MTNASNPDVVARLEKLEKQNRRLRWLAALGVVLAGLLTLNLAWAGLRIGRFAKLDARHIELRAGPSEDADFALYDNKGNRRVLLRANDLTFKGEDQQDRLWIKTSEDGGGIVIAGRNGEELAHLSATRGKNYFARLFLGPQRVDSHGLSIQVREGPGVEGSTSLALMHGNFHVGLYSRPEEVGLYLTPREGVGPQERVKLSVTQKEARFTLYDKNGKEIFTKP